MQNRPLSAAAAILTGMAILGWIDQYVRVIAETSSLWTFHILRPTMIWGLTLIWLVVARQRLKVLSWRGLALRSGVMSSGLVIYFGALAFMPVAQAAAGLFTSPIWVLIFSVLFFGQGIGWVRCLAVGLGFLGIILVLAPTPDTLSPLIFMPVLAGAFYAVGVLGTRAWCAQEGALELALGIFSVQFIIGLIFGVALTLIEPAAEAGTAGFVARGIIWPSSEVLFWTFVQALGSLLAVVLLTRGYQLAEASYVAVFEYALLLFSCLFGYLVWGDLLTLWQAVGLGLIIAAGCVIALRARDMG